MTLNLSSVIVRMQPLTAETADEQCEERLRLLDEFLALAPAAGSDNAQAAIAAALTLAEHRRDHGC